MSTLADSCYDFGTERKPMTMDAPHTKRLLPQLKNDAFRRARGGSAHFLVLTCARCASYLMLYQKDGSGRLQRCYLNRIFDPPELETLQRAFTGSSPKDLPPLRCGHCNELVGIPMRHNDQRLAFRLINGTIAKSKL